MSNLVDLAKARRARAHWGGMVVLRPGEEADVTAEMVDFWGDDLREPPFRLRMWADALDALTAQMRQTAAELEGQPA